MSGSVHDHGYLQQDKGFVREHTVGLNRCVHRLPNDVGTNRYNHRHHRRHHSGSSYNHHPLHYFLKLRHHQLLQNQTKYKFH
jgi:hypothetical protein